MDLNDYAVWTLKSIMNVFSNLVPKTCWKAMIIMPHIFLLVFFFGVEVRYQICKLYSFNSRALDTLLFPHLNIFDMCFRMYMQEVTDLLLKFRKFGHLPCSRYYTGC